MIYLVATVAWSALAALLSWHLAVRQGRRARAWALWTFLLGGLPLLVPLIHEILGMPKFGGGVQHVCCPQQSWTPVADLGHAAGANFDLGRCGRCGAWLMAVFYAVSTTFVVITREQAERLLSLQGTPDLKRALKAWLD